MGYNRADYVRIKNEYNNKYARARQAADRCRDEVHQNIPEVAELDRMLSRVGSEIMGIIVAGGDQVEERVSALKERNLALADKRHSIFEKVGMTTFETVTGSGGSDAADVTVYGKVSCVDCLGIVGGRIHSPEEFALIDSLPEMGKRLAAIIYYF